MAGSYIVAVLELDGSMVYTPPAENVESMKGVIKNGSLQDLKKSMASFMEL